MFKTILSTLDKNKTPPELDIDKIPSYIFCRWLAGSPQTIMAANQINNFHNEIPMINQYNMVKSAFAGKIKYIAYPKNIQEDIRKNVQYLAEYFKISEEKAKDYLEVISDKELNMIINMYTEYELKGNK
jgi:hypothetical protein